METATKKSTHRVEVVPVHPQPHPNGDALELVKIYGFQVCVQKGAYKPGDLGAYVVPDSVVDTARPEFAFLLPQAKADGTYRVKVKRLRKIWSEGLLVPAPVGAKEGDDVSDILGVTRYEPPEPGTQHGPKGVFLGGESASPPTGTFPKYDLESWNRYKHLLEPGESVRITEKVHGCNARFVYVDGKMHCGSRTEWKKEYPSYDHITIDTLLSRGVSPEKAQEIYDRVHGKKQPRNLWWRALDNCPAIEAFCQKHPGLCLYGECAGQVQDLRYGTSAGELFIKVFDIWDSTQYRYLDYLDALELLLDHSVPVVPLLYAGPYCETITREMAAGKTTINDAGHCREGCVIRPAIERIDDRIGRVVLKLINNEYLER